MFATFVLFTVLAGQFWRNLLSWWGFGAVALVVLGGSIAWLVMLKPDWMWRRFPKSLGVFLALATLSIGWSFYPGASAIGVALQWTTTIAALFLALCLTWAELIRTLSTALRWVLGLSLLFEVILGVFVRQPVFPFFVDYGTERVPGSFYWSRALLFEGGPIEGIVANRNLLGFVALLAVIVFAIQLVAGSGKRGWGVAWLVLAIVMLILTRSATVTVAAVVVAVVLLFALWARRVGQLGRRPVYLTAAASVVAVIAALAQFAPQLLSVLGKKDGLTGRFDIWASVVDLASQRPAFGWGWVSYWAPWVEPFDNLAVRKGVEYLQAHNAWLDVWLQLGIAGLIAFGALVVATLWRSWFLAVDRPFIGPAVVDSPSTPAGPRSLPSDAVTLKTLPTTTAGVREGAYPATALLPLLLSTALLAQGLAESRLLIEYGWVLLVVLAVMTKRQQSAPYPMP
jgi:exopolysaccharide production protein ExoQ